MSESLGVHHMKKAKSFISRHLALLDYATWAICLAAVIAIPLLRHRLPVPLGLFLLLAAFAAKLAVIVLRRRKA